MARHRDHPTGCTECERLGCPTEGMTLTCHTCGAVICGGHVKLHEEQTGHAVKEPDPIAA